MSELSPAPRLTTAQRRQDVWLAAGLLVAAVLSAWLGSTASVYGTESAPFSWTLAYAVALTVPIAFRRRVPIVVLVVIAVAFFTGVSLRIPEVYVGNVTLFIAMYTVGAWVEDRRRATLARVLVIVGMFVWLTVVTFEASAGDDGGLSRAGLFSPFAAYMVLQFLVNAAFFGGAYLFGERAWMQARSRAALEARTAELEREEKLAEAMAIFKELCDRKEIVTSDDLEAMINSEILSAADSRKIALRSFLVQVGEGHGTATITLDDDGRVTTDAAAGNGPVDAAYRAIRRIVGFEPGLEDYSIRSVTEDTDAIGEARVVLDMEGIQVTGRGASTDIIEASIRAYIDGINRLMRMAALKGVRLYGKNAG